MSGRSAAAAMADLSFAEVVCLTLVAQGVEHGWALGTQLSARSELGRVWTLSRPLTYRAVDQLAVKKLLRRGPPVGGRERTRLTCTALGRRVVDVWLDAPVAHLRDVRTELVMKLELRRRSGLDPAPLLRAQREAFGSRFDALIVRESGDIVQLWRRESARAIRRFLDAALDNATLDRAALDHAALDQAAPGQRRSAERHAVVPQLRLSARNQLRAQVTEVHHRGLMTSVTTRLADGQRLCAIVTKDAAEDLDLAPDDDVVVVLTSTEVVLAKE